MDECIDRHGGHLLYQQFSVRPEIFTTILIGKDGQVKLYRKLSADLEEIFAEIDRMPMRRWEIMEKAQDRVGGNGR
jgi:hypothetical protein